jgi:hypothetical protein
MSATPPKLRCRQIVDADINDIVDLLTRGFPRPGRGYWARALARLAERDPPPGLPQYGQMLEHEGNPVGVILVIFSEIPTPQGPALRGNMSSWYVEPAFRGYAGLMINAAIRHKNVTYINISPAVHTRPIIEAQGFRQYAGGQFVAIPALAPVGETVSVIPASRTPAVPYDPAEQTLLERHVALGCIGLWCETAERAYPFAFLPRAVKGIVPAAQLVYCGDFADFLRFAGPIGRHLAWRGRGFVIVDANGPIAGLVGRYVDGKAPKYAKGARPGFGDIAYTEAILFGL